MELLMDVHNATAKHAGQALHQHGMFLALTSLENGALNVSLHGSDNYVPVYANPLDAHPMLQYFFVFCLAMQSFFGTIGNILVMGAVCTVPALRMTGNYFIINLAIADVFVTAVTQPANILGALRGERWFQERPIFCSIIGTLCSTGCISSTWNICMISVNRYILICHNDSYHKIYTKWKTLLMCIGVWLLIYAIELPNHVGWGDKRFSVVFFVCTFANHVHSYAMFFIGLGVLVPVGASFLAYLGIYLKVRNSSLVQRRISRRSIEKIQSKNQRAQYRLKRRIFRENVQVAHALFRVFVIFVLMWLPVAILILLGKGTDIPHIWYILTVLLAHGNSSINCVVYAASIDHFREGYFKLLGIKRSRRKGYRLSAEAYALADRSTDLSLRKLRRGPTIKPSPLDNGDYSNSDDTSGSLNTRCTDTTLIPKSKKLDVIGCRLSKDVKGDSQLKLISLGESPS